MEKKEENKGDEGGGFIIPGFKSVDDFSQQGFKAMMEATRAFQVLPKAGPVWDLRTSYPEFKSGLKKSRLRLISSMTKLLQHSKFSPQDFRKLDVEDKFDFLVETNDDMLERIATSLDKAEGLFKRKEILVVNPNAPPAVSQKPPGTWAEKKHIRLNSAPATAAEATFSASTASPSTSSEQTTSTISARKIKRARYTNRVREKPQLKFKTPVDNSVSPFIPRLFDKPHSIKPLSILPEYNESNEEFYGHPYAVEINSWKPSPKLLEKNESPVYPNKVEDTPFEYIDSPRAMEKMLRELGKADEVAVDVEHHSYRSFLGITCLIQISTRTHDYIIDGLTMRDQMHNLNEIFADPKILKVFHSANSDIEWLQKDYGVYVVGMFDTAIAARTLSFPQISLQFLLSDLCGTTTDKGYQLADWRIRPIPQEMLHYARIDTHYLLYMYDLLKNRLIEAGNEENDQLSAVYEKSRILCLKRYEKPLNNPQVALRKSRRSFNNRQLYCFTELFKWRDTIAREKDESLGYVLPNHMLLTMAESLPKEMTGIMACCDPVPPLVHSNVGLIHRIIQKARELPMHDVNETSMQNKIQKKGKQKNWLLMMNSMYEVDLNEHDVENQGKSAPGGEYSSDWWKSIDWSDLKSKPSPAISFNASLRLTSSSKENSGVNSENGKTIKATPYQRYRITNEIIEKLKDPQKKLDQEFVENPIVKSVIETILVDQNAKDNEETEEALPTPSKKSKFDQEFVPFNPMCIPKKEKGKGKKRKVESYDDDRGQEDEKRRKRSQDNEEEEDDENDHIMKIEGGILGVGDEDMPIILSGDESDTNTKTTSNKNVNRSSKTPENSNQNKKKSNKKQRKNFLKKLTNRGKKRKYNVDEKQQQELTSPQNLEDGEIQDDEEVIEVSPSPSSSKSKQQQSPRLTKHQKKNFDPRNNKRNDNKNNNKGNNYNNTRFDQNGQDNNNPNKKNNQSPRKGGGNRGGKKKNFWNFNQSGKSITFK